MKSFIFALLVVLMFVALPVAADEEVIVETVSVECNWGTLTMEAIKDGFPQGEHSADPNGDGKGQGSDQPRTGLANVLERGNLQLTCEFIQSLLDD
jgi:hypothetical protein